MKFMHVVEIATAAQRISSIKLPVKAAYRVAKIMELLKLDVQFFEEHRNKLLQEFGTTEDGKTYQLKDVEGFTKALDGLLDDEVTVTLPTIPIDLLGDVGLEPEVLRVLMRNGVVVDG